MVQGLVAQDAARQLVELKQQWNSVLWLDPLAVAGQVLELKQGLNSVLAAILDCQAVAAIS